MESITLWRLYITSWKFTRPIPAILTAGTDRLWTRKRLQTQQYYFPRFTYCSQKPFFLHAFLKICTEIKVFFYFLSSFWRTKERFRLQAISHLYHKRKSACSTGVCRWRVSYVNEWTITYSSIRFKYILYITMLLFSVKKRDNKCCEERAILDWRGHPQLNVYL